jgi:hypothetical protein
MRSLLGDSFPKLIASEPWLERHFITQSEMARASERRD